MFDLIKTFIEGLWIDKKYRYIFLFILITLCYRCVKTSVIYTQEEITPVKFVKMNSDASMELVYLSKDFTLHPSKMYTIPNKNSKDECERNFYNEYFLVDIQSLIRSASDNTFIVRFERHFPFFAGDIYYYNDKDDRKGIFDELHIKGDIFDELEKPIDFCKKYHDRKNKVKEKQRKLINKHK